MHVTIGKLLSLLVALGYLVGFGVVAGGVDGGLLCACGYLLIPLALIWFPEQFGSIPPPFHFTRHRSRIDASTGITVVSMSL